MLRSPYEHHPGVEGYRDCELRDFARTHWALLTPVERREIRMSQAGHRSVVPVDVFEAYCRHTAAIHGVPARLWRGVVRALDPGPEQVTVRGDGHAGGFEIDARYVVLCQGEERRAAPAGWWSGTRPAAVGYWDEPPPGTAGHEVVVGAGLTSAHLIHNALARGSRVSWVLREESERYQCSDVNASFFRAEGRARFDNVPWADRLALMRRERRASVMFEFRPELRAAEADGRLTVHRDAEVAAVGEGEVLLAGGGRVAGDHVWLALGTVPSIGAGLLPDDVVAARDGWPDLDERTLAFRARHGCSRRARRPAWCSARPGATSTATGWPPPASPRASPPACGTRRWHMSEDGTGYDTEFALPAVDDEPDTEIGVLLMGLESERVLAGLGVAADGRRPGRRDPGRGPAAPRRPAGPDVRGGARHGCRALAGGTAAAGGGGPRRRVPVRGAAQAVVGGRGCRGRRRRGGRCRAARVLRGLLAASCPDRPVVRRAWCHTLNIAFGSSTAAWPLRMAWCSCRTRGDGSTPRCSTISARNLR